MFSVEVELLTGTYTATHYNDRDRPEWPPHPARLYSAMVAAWADVDQPDPREADALRWFEAQSDPAISCSALGADQDGVAVRTLTTHFVPVNDVAAVRDLSGIYSKLVESEAELMAAASSGDEKATAKATKAVAKARAKAASDSQKAASGEAATTALALLPENRGKQGRSYPTVRPDHPVATFTWGDADPDPDTLTALDGLLARVGRLGHSSSLVSCRVADAAADPTYVPDETGETVVRLPGTGQLDRLRELYESHQGRDPRQLPARMVRYGLADSPVLARPGSSLADRFIAAAFVDGPRLTVRDSLPIARAIRNALISHAGHDGREVPELISGHLPRAGGQASTPRADRPHMAVVPLPFVGHSHADGLLKGVAILIPPEAEADERDLLLGAIGRWLQVGVDPDDRAPNLWGAELGARRWMLERAPIDNTPITLRRSRWSTSARIWATVTPIALDRYPDGLWRGSAAKRARAESQASESISRSCANIGLPAPIDVEIRSDAPLRGVAPLRRYPQFRSGPAGAPRPSVHAVIEFGEPVTGPVVLGRGRYLGQGLCFPLKGGDDE